MLNLKAHLRVYTFQLDILGPLQLDIAPEFVYFDFEWGRRLYSKCVEFRFKQLVLCLFLVDEFGELLVLIEEVGIMLQNELDLLFKLIDFLDLASEDIILLCEHAVLLL